MLGLRSKNLIKLEVTPEQVEHGLPNGFIRNYELGRGFSSRFMVLADKNSAEFVSISLSFDGESELLAQIVDNNYGYSEEKCLKFLQRQFPELV